MTVRIKTDYIDKRLQTFIKPLWRTLDFPKEMSQGAETYLAQSQNKVAQLREHNTHLENNEQTYVARVES